MCLPTPLQLQSKRVIQCLGKHVPLSNIHENIQQNHTKRDTLAIFLTENVIIMVHSLVIGHLLQQLNAHDGSCLRIKGVSRERKSTKFLCLFISVSQLFILSKDFKFEIRVQLCVVDTKLQELHFISVIKDSLSMAIMNQFFFDMKYLWSLSPI